MRWWVRWMTATVAVIGVFWLGLIAGRWLPLVGNAEDNGWTAATTLAGILSTAAGVPLFRWAEQRHQPPQEEEPGVQETGRGGTVPPGPE